MRRGAGASLAVAVLLASGPAAASASFPEAMVMELELQTAPGCDLCHRNAAEPIGPADKPFGKSAIERGLVAGDLASLEKALERMRDDGVDSDGDGAVDLDELYWGDPNHADRPLSGYQPPVDNGCSAAPRPAGDAGGVAALTLLALAARRAARSGGRRGAPRRAVDPRRRHLV